MISGKSIIYAMVHTFLYPAGTRMYKKKIVYKNSQFF